MPKRKYKFVSHTAEVEFVAYGKNLKECFENALYALFNTISYTKRVSASKPKSTKFMIKDKARNIDDLLWYVLQDALSIADANELFPYRVSGLKITGKKGAYKISTTIFGKSRESAYSKIDAKGIPRYNLRVESKGKQTLATVVIDV